MYPWNTISKSSDQSSIKISFTLPERYLPLITSGTPIKFSTGLSEEQYSASITATEPGLDAKDRSLQVQAIAVTVVGNSGLENLLKYISVPKRKAQKVL